MVNYGGIIPDNFIDGIKNYLREILSTQYEIRDVTIISVTPYSWSYIVVVNVIMLSHDTVKIFCKIPRMIPAQEFADAITSRVNQESAENEFRTLKKIHYFVSGAKHENVVKPIGFLMPFNAIILEEMQGDKLYDLLCKKKLSGKHCCEIFKRIGQFLNNCHNISPIVFTEYVVDEELYSFRGVSRVFDMAINRVHNVAKHNMPMGSIFLGFEIRNIFCCSENDQLTFHDLAETENRPIYEDIAQFLVSMDLFHWGKPFRKPLPSKYFSNFLNGYFNNTVPSSEVLSFFIVKEYLRFYRNSLAMLQQKVTIPFLRKIIGKYYLLKWVEKRISKNFIDEM